MFSTLTKKSALVLKMRKAVLKKTNKDIAINRKICPTIFECSFEMIYQNLLTHKSKILSVQTEKKSLISNFLPNLATLHLPLNDT